MKSYHCANTIVICTLQTHHRKPEQVAGPGEDRDSVEKPTLEQFMKNCSLWEGLTLEKFVEDCLPWEGSHAGAGEECEEEGMAETTRYELTITPMPCPPAPLAGRK